MKFSVIIPALNEEKNLPQLLSSLEKQTYKDFEVIVADGHSEDKTKEKALEFQNSFPLKFVECPIRKVTVQRNFGAKQAIGEYFIFLDSDYKAVDNFVHVIAATIDKTEASVVVPISIPDTKYRFWKAYYAIANWGSFLTLFIKKPFVVGSAVCIKKEMFEKIGGYDEAVVMYEDQYIVQQSFAGGAKIAFSKAKVYFSTRRQESDGIPKFLYENMVSTLYLLFKGPIKKELFKYKMGGQEFKKN